MAGKDASDQASKETRASKEARQRVLDEVARLVAVAEAESGHTTLTTHEAKDHFRRTGKTMAWERLHILMFRLGQFSPDD